MTVKSDDQCRVESRKVFKPNTSYGVEISPDGRVVLTELTQTDVPVVKPVRTQEGFIMLPVKISREAIRRAIRADRDVQ